MSRGVDVLDLDESKKVQLANAVFDDRPRSCICGDPVEQDPVMVAVSDAPEMESKEYRLVARYACVAREECSAAPEGEGRACELTADLTYSEVMVELGERWKSLTVPHAGGDNELSC